MGKRSVEENIPGKALPVRDLPGRGLLRGDRFCFRQPQLPNLQNRHPKTVSQVRTFDPRGGLLLIGGMFFILPRFTRESELLYTLSPWIWLTCFLFYSRTIEKKKDGLFFFLAVLAACEIRYRHFLSDDEPILGLIAMLLAVLVALITVLPFFLDRFYLKHRQGMAVLFLFPVLRVLAEQIFPGKQFNLSLTQFDNKWLLQSASFFGEPFLSFLVALIPSVLVGMYLYGSSKRIMIAGRAVLFLCALVFILGGIRYQTAPLPAGFIRMAHASGPIKPYYENPSEEEASFSENIAYLERTTAEAAREGAKLIAYAEEAFILTAEEKEAFIQAAQTAAAQNDLFILLGLDTLDKEDHLINQAVLIDQAGNLLSDYTKAHLIPVLENDYLTGNGVIPSNLVTIDGQERVISYTVCYDATFPSYLLSMDPETDLFINPSWDWDEIVDLNYRLQGLSAVECGVVLFKPTADGWCTVTDPYGRISYKESTLRADYDQVFYADVPAASVPTVYRKIHALVRG